MLFILKVIIILIATTILLDFLALTLFVISKIVELIKEMSNK